MANTFIPKKSTIAGKVPLPSQLSGGEVTVNWADQAWSGKHPGTNAVVPIGAPYQHSHDQLLSLDPATGAQGIYDLELTNDGDLTISDGAIVTTISPSSTVSRTLTLPNKSGTIALTTDIGGGGGGALTVSKVLADGSYTGAVTGVTGLRFDEDSGFDVTDLGDGNAKVQMNSTFKYWQVDGQPGLTAQGLDTANFIAGSGVTIAADSVNNSLTFSSAVGVSDGDKGDVTVSGSGATWTIDSGAVSTAKLADGAVTYAKMQNVSAADRLLGRSTAGAGAVEEVVCTSAGRAILDDVDAASQRTTLGLGNSATLNTGSTAGTVATGNHTHTIADVSNLQTSLDAKAALSHTHTIAQVTGLSTSLTQKSDVGHTHTMSQITDLTFPAASVYYGDTAPTDPTYNLWIQTSTARIFNKIDGYWVEAAAGFGPLVIENTGGGTGGGTPTPLYHAAYYKSSNQNLISGSTDITFDQNATWSNIGGLITQVSGSADFTVVAPGVYQLEWNASVMINGATWNTGTSKIISIDINRGVEGEKIIAGQSAVVSQIDYTQSVSSTIELKAGDIINLRVQQNHATATPYVAGVNGSDLNTWFYWRYLSAGTQGGDVVSVNGLAGAVTLTPSVIGAANATHNHTIADVTNLQTNLNAKVTNGGGVASIVKVSVLPVTLDPNTLYIVV